MVYWLVVAVIILRSDLWYRRISTALGSFPGILEFPFLLLRIGFPRYAKNEDSCTFIWLWWRDPPKLATWQNWTKENLNHCTFIFTAGTFIACPTIKDRKAGELAVLYAIFIGYIDSPKGRGMAFCPLTRSILSFNSLAFINRTFCCPWWGMKLCWSNARILKFGLAPNCSLQWHKRIISLSLTVSASIMTVG